MTGKMLQIRGSRGPLQHLKRQLKAEGALLDGDLRPSVRRTIWANGDREQVIAIRARAFSQATGVRARAPSSPLDVEPSGNTTQ